MKLHFDIDEYNDKRGLNIDLDEELPGCVFQDFKDIMNSIKDKEYDFERLNTFRNKYVKETRHATKDIVEIFIMKRNLKILLIKDYKY